MRFTALLLSSAALSSTILAIPAPQDTYTDISADNYKHHNDTGHMENATTTLPSSVYVPFAHLSHLCPLSHIRASPFPPIPSSPLPLLYLLSRTPPKKPSLPPQCCAISIDCKAQSKALQDRTGRSPICCFLSVMGLVCGVMRSERMGEKDILKRVWGKVVIP
jgi:hypothetical protein